MGGVAVDPHHVTLGQAPFGMPVLDAAVAPGTVGEADRQEVQQDGQVGGIGSRLRPQHLLEDLFGHHGPGLVDTALDLDTALDVAGVLLASVIDFLSA